MKIKEIAKDFLRKEPIPAANRLIDESEFRILYNKLKRLNFRFVLFSGFYEHRVDYIMEVINSPGKIDKWKQDMILMYIKEIYECNIIDRINYKYGI